MFSDLLQQLLLALLPNEPVYYIGGSEVLPPPLSREEETAALTALCAGDKSAERTLIEHNLRLVVYIARRFENTGVGLEDLISIGTIGLIKAVSTFDREKNIKLATYASRCIENEILMYLRKLAAQRTEVSFDEPLNTDWDGNELLLSDVLGTDEDQVSRPMEDDADRRALHEAVAKLSERDRDIISLRFGLLGRREYTQKEVADRMGISQSYISRLEKRILLRLRREMQKIMARLRSRRGSLFAPLGKPDKILDYEKGVDELPRSNVLKFFFPNGSWVAVRPSGTEPKIKFYYCIRGKDQRQAQDLYEAVQTSVEEFLRTF